MDYRWKTARENEVVAGSPGDAPYPLFASRKMQFLIAGLLSILLVGAAAYVLSGCATEKSTTTTSTRGISPGSAAAGAQRTERIGQILFDGDSLTAGSGATDPYPDQVMRRLPPDIKWRNLAVGGRPIRYMLRTAPTRVDPLYNPRLDRNVVILWGGSNDMALYDHEADAVYQDIREYCLGRRQAGFTTLVLTILPRADRFSPGFEPKRQALNQMLRAQWRGFSDGLVDVAADPRIGPAGAARDLRYYNLSFVHLNNVGLSIVAGYVLDGIHQLEGNQAR